MDPNNCKYATKRNIEKALFEGKVVKNIPLPSGPLLTSQIAELERKMRSRRFINGCNLKKFKGYTVKYGCNDEKSLSTMSIFFVFIASEQKVYHTKRKRDIQITSNTKQIFINAMKNSS